MRRTVTLAGKTHDLHFNADGTNHIEDDGTTRTVTYTHNGVKSGYVTTGGKTEYFGIREQAKPVDPETPAPPTAAQTGDKDRADFASKHEKKVRAEVKRVLKESPAMTYREARRTAESNVAKTYAPKPTDPATAHASTLPEGSPARAAIEAALANGGGDKRKTLKELGYRHAEMAAQMSPEEEAGYVEMMGKHGVKPLHEPGQTVPFDAATMQSDAGISTGTPVKVTRRGWSGLYGDERTGHENIGNNVQRAQVEPAGSATVGMPAPGAKPVAAKTARKPKVAPAAPTPTPVAPAQPKAAAVKVAANGLPDVKPGAAKTPDAPEYQAAGKAMMADDGFRKDLADSYNHQRLFVEHRDGLIPLDRVYHELAKRRPGVTIDQFHAAIDQVNRDHQQNGIELHAVNEFAKIPADEKLATISRNDRNYHYMRFKGGADPEKMRPV